MTRNVWNCDYFSKSDLHTRRQCSSVGGQLEGAKEVQGKFSSKKMAQKWCRDGSLMILIWPVKTKVEPPFVKGGRKFCTLSPLDIFGKNKGPLMCCWACALWVKPLRIWSGFHWGLVRVTLLDNAPNKVVGCIIQKRKVTIFLSYQAKLEMIRPQLKILHLT